MARESRGRDNRGGRNARDDRDNEFVDKLVHINRVAKVVTSNTRRHRSSTKKGLCNFRP